MGMDANIYLNKTNLLTDLLKFDLSKMSTKNIQHITKDKFDKILEIDLLLKYGENNDVCLKIKNITIQLDYKWEYSTYC